MRSSSLMQPSNPDRSPIRSDRPSGPDPAPCKKCGRQYPRYERQCPGCGARRVGYTPAFLVLAIMVLLLELVLVAT